MRAVSRLGCSQLSPIHVEFLCLASPAVPKSSFPSFHWPTGQNIEQEDALFSLPDLAVIFTCQWLWSQPSFCREAESQVGDYRRMMVPSGNEATGELHWNVCALCGLHPVYSLCFQAPEQWGSDLPLRPARGELVGLEERRWWAPGPVRSQSLCLRLQVQQ